MSKDCWLFSCRHLVAWFFVFPCLCFSHSLCMFLCLWLHVRIPLLCASPFLLSGFKPFTKCMSLLCQLLVSYPLDSSDLLLYSSIFYFFPLSAFAWHIALLFYLFFSLPETHRPVFWFENFFLHFFFILCKVNLMFALHTNITLKFKRKLQHLANVLILLQAIHLCICQLHIEPFYKRPNKLANIIIKKKWQFTNPPKIVGTINKSSTNPK